MGYKRDQREVQSEFFGNKGGGLFNNKTYNFVLKEEFRKDNLYENIADEAIKYFEENKIGWWRGKENLPTNHMLSSQVACVNHLLWIMKNEDAATQVLKGIDPGFKAIAFPKLKDSSEENYVDFEYDGYNLTHNNGRNIIGEKRSLRGATSTSIDATMLAQKGEQKVLIFIEWKYVENYSGTAVNNMSKKYKNEKSTYKNLLEINSSPIKMNLLIENDKCDYNIEYVKFSIEPYYQLMRQTLLAWQLTEENHIIADDYIHVHVIPNGNVQLLEGRTSPNISNGINICNGWKTCLKNSNKYMHIDAKKLIGATAFKYNLKLYQYLSDRYWK